MNNSFEQIDKVFFQDGYQTAEKILNRHINRDTFIQLTKILYANIDSLLDAFTGRLKRENRNLSCKKACSWCCHQPVYTNAWELAYLNYFIKKRFSPDRLTKIRRNAESKDREVSGLSPEELAKTRLSCPLLMNNVCSVYPARPMACRIYLSYDLESCIAQYKNTGTNHTFAKLYDFPLHAGRKLNEGIAAYLEENNFKVMEYRLEKGIIENE